MTDAFYNEIEPFAVAWLKNLAEAGHIAKGTVDGRSIKEIHPSDLAGHAQCHFFAGIGVWSYALRLAGWPDDLPVWTGSCPCQPFSGAGKGEGFADPRHLWPDWFKLIKECRPSVVFGEQVASKDGLKWLDLVRADLEAAGYAFGAVDFAAAGVGAPHIRQRLYWTAIRLADDDDAGCRFERGEELHADGDAPQRHDLDRRGAAGGMGDAEDEGCQGYGRPVDLNGSQGRDAAGRHGATAGFWSDADWISCLDGKWRPVRPGSCPLAHGAAARVGRLRAYGNAIVGPQAAEFVKAVMDVMQDCQHSEKVGVMSVDEWTNGGGK